MSSDGSSEKVRLKVDDEVEFLLTQEQLRIMEITSKEGDSFYSCKTSCHDNSFEEFDSAMSLLTDLGEKSFIQEYEDITPVPSESDCTPTSSFAEKNQKSSGDSKTTQESLIFSPRKLDAIALLSARFHLIHSPGAKIESIVTDEKTKDESLPRDESTQSANDLNDKTESAASRFEENIETVSDSIPTIQNKINTIPEVEMKANLEASTPKPSKSIPSPKTKTIAKSQNSAPKPLPVRTIRPPTKSCLSSGNRDNHTSENSSEPHNASLDIDGMSARLLKNPGPKKLQEQSFKGSPVQLSKLLTPNKSKVPSKVGKIINAGPATENRNPTPKLKTPTAVSRIPKKCFIQSARVFGKQLVPENLMKSPKPLITIHKHSEIDKSRQVHINESVYETFEAVAAKCKAKQSHELDTHG